MIHPVRTAVGACRRGRESTRARTQQGMTTAEYAFGIIAAVGFACLLFLLVDGMSSLFKHTLGSVATLVGAAFGL